MQREECQKPEAGKGKALRAPACVHLYVWVFMIALSVSPMLFLLTAHAGLTRSDARESLQLVGLLQAALYLAQIRCSSEGLTYWEGLLAAAASVTTGENLRSFLRSFPLLLAIVILSIGFALDHDKRSASRHAQLRFGKLIVWVHQQRLRR